MHSGRSVSAVGVVCGQKRFLNSICWPKILINLEAIAAGSATQIT